MRMIYEKGYRFPETRLTVIENLPPKNQHSQVRCVCDCGNGWVGSAAYPKHKKTKSCGCLVAEMASKTHKTHGLRGHPLYNVWRHMKERCYAKNDKEYCNYGGRGITVCDEWMDSFKAFYDWAIKFGYEKGLTIERNDVNGNYTPDNCRWATNKEQQRNRRNNRHVTINAETKTVSEWSEVSGVNSSAIYARLNRGCVGEEIIKPSLGQEYYQFKKGHKKHGSQ